MSTRQSYYIGVKGIIKNELGDILILQDKGSRWEVPGGRIDKDESIVDAFLREIEEELIGAKVISLDEVVYVAQGDFLVENEHRLFLTFYSAKVRLPEVIELGDEHIDYAWVNKDNLMDYALFNSDLAAVRRTLL